MDLEAIKKTLETNEIWFMSAGQMRNFVEELVEEVERLRGAQKAMMGLLADELGLPADDFPAMIAEIQQREIQHARLIVNLQQCQDEVERLRAERDALKRQVDWHETR